MHGYIPHSLSLYFNWIIITPSPHISSTFTSLWPTATVPLQCFFLLIGFGEGRKEDSCMSWLRREGIPCSNPPLPVHQWLATMLCTPCLPQTSSYSLLCTTAPHRPPIDDQHAASDTSTYHTPRSLSVTFDAGQWPSRVPPRLPRGETKPHAGLHANDCAVSQFFCRALDERRDCPMVSRFPAPLDTHSTPKRSPRTARQKHHPSQPIACPPPSLFPRAHVVATKSASHSL
jgi:hypothetical protein